MRRMIDDLDAALLRTLREKPRAGDLELSRSTGAARATVQSRLRKLAAAGVIRDWVPTLDPAAGGYPVQAFVTLEISQGALEEVRADLLAIPQVLEAYVTTGSFDVVCKVATASHAQLQEVLVRIDQAGAVVRSTSVVALSVLIEPRVLDLLAVRDDPGTGAGPA